MEREGVAGQDLITLASQRHMARKESVTGMVIRMPKKGNFAEALGAAGKEESNGV